MSFEKYNAQLQNKIKKTNFGNPCFNLYFMFQIVYNIIIVQLIKFVNFIF